MPLAVKMDESTAHLVDSHGRIHATGELRPSEGAEFLLNATTDGAEISVELRFVGKVVNT